MIFMNDKRPALTLLRLPYAKPWRLEEGDSLSEFVSLKLILCLQFYTGSILLEASPLFQVVDYIFVCEFNMKYNILEEIEVVIPLYKRNRLSPNQHEAKTGTIVSPRRQRNATKWKVAAQKHGKKNDCIKNGSNFYSSSSVSINIEEIWRGEVRNKNMPSSFINHTQRLLRELSSKGGSQLLICHFTNCNSIWTRNFLDY